MYISQFRQGKPKHTNARCFGVVEGPPSITRFALGGTVHGTIRGGLRYAVLTCARVS